MLPNHMIQKACAMALSASFLMLAQPALAAGPITIAAKIPYLNDGVASPAIRAECTWNSDVPAAIVAKSKGGVVSTDQDLASVHGRKLTVTVVNLHAAGGGGFSGPKWIAMRGELNEDGKVLGNFDFRRTTSHGRMTTCATLDYIGKALTQDILKWLKNPTTNAAPGDAGAATDQASGA